MSNESILYTKIAMQVFFLSRTLYVETLQRAGVCIKSRMITVQKEKQNPPPHTVCTCKYDMMKLFRRTGSHPERP
jgi:hypothetical protein